MPKARKYSKKNCKRGGVKKFSKLPITDTDLFPTDRPEKTQTEVKEVKIIKKGDMPIADSTIFPENDIFDRAREVREMAQEDRDGQQRILQEYMDAYNQPMPLFEDKDDQKNSKKDGKKCDGITCVISGGHKSRRNRRKGRKSRKHRKH